MIIFTMKYGIDISKFHGKNTIYETKKQENQHKIIQLKPF